MEEIKKKKWKRTCEAKVKNRCRTFEKLKLIKNEENKLLVCEYHLNWHLEKGYKVIEFIKKPTKKTFTEIDDERSYTVDGNVFVKLSDFERPRSEKFISNLHELELNEDIFAKFFKKNKKEGKND